MEHLSAAHTRFSLSLFQKISEGQASANVFYSPLSISAALSMLSLGAGGNTASQMSRVSLKLIRLQHILIWDYIVIKFPCESNLYLNGKLQIQ